jgi:uncharacterized protein (DUF302 family)
MIRIEVERFSLTSSKPFDEVVAGINAAIGHPDMAEFGRSTHEARSFDELKSAVEKGLSKAGLMLFLQLDQGAVLRKETGRDTPRIIRLVIGNPLIMKEMAKHVPDAGSYAPVTVLVDERADGVHLSYDRMVCFLAPYGNSEARSVARDLDSKIETLLRECAAVLSNFPLRLLQPAHQLMIKGKGLNELISTVHRFEERPKDTQIVKNHNSGYLNEASVRSFPSTQESYYLSERPCCDC